MKLTKEETKKFLECYTKISRVMLPHGYVWGREIAEKVKQIHPNAFVFHSYRSAFAIFKDKSPEYDGYNLSVMFYGDPEVWGHPRTVENIKLVGIHIFIEGHRIFPTISINGRDAWIIDNEDGLPIGEELLERWLDVNDHTLKEILARSEAIKRLTPFFKFLEKEFKYQKFNWDEIDGNFSDIIERLFSHDRVQVTLDVLATAKGVLIEHYNLHDDFYGTLVRQDEYVQTVYKEYMDVERIQKEYDEDMKSGLFKSEYKESLLYWSFEEGKAFEATWEFDKKKFELCERKQW